MFEAGTTVTSRNAVSLSYVADVLQMQPLLAAIFSLETALWFRDTFIQP
jgi:hypothetical protein